MQGGLEPWFNLSDLVASFFPIAKAIITEGCGSVNKALNHPQLQIDQVQEIPERISGFEYTGSEERRYRPREGGHGRQLGSCDHPNFLRA